MYSLDFRQSNFIDVDLVASEMGRSVFPVIVRSPDGSVRNEGTAFVVLGTVQNEMVIATAKHVLQAAIDDPSADLMVLVPRADDIQHLIGIRPSLVGLADKFSDVALVVLDLSTALAVINPKVMPISVAEPEVGTRCLALGYGRTASQMTGTNDLKAFLSASQGEITQIHNPMRDRSLSTFPTFEVGAMYAPGMSGGPILDTAGRVIGIVSHGFDGG